MFEYCRRVLGLRENEAYLRITVARAARENPVLWDMLRDSRLHLSGIARLAPHLTRQNSDAVLRRASGMSYREIRELVCELEPKPDVAPTIWKLPCRASSTSVASAQLGAHRVESGGLNSEPRVARRDRPPVVEPLAPNRHQVRFTASSEIREKLERLQALMRSSVPDGDLARIIDIAVTEKLQRVEAKRFAKTKAPRKGLAETDTTPSSRHIPAPVRRVVHDRDGGRCAYTDRHGRRCAKRHDLEFTTRNSSPAAATTAPAT